MFVLIALFILLTVYVSIADMDKEAKTPYFIFSAIMTIFIVLGVVF